MNTEKRRFGMHANLLYDVITKQAGTVQKAILEGVMNAIDAGATRCDVEFSGTHFSIRDDGRGFADMNEIEKFFETFGTPHQDGDARYGRFRMGRGQIMAFGVNVWRSNGFEMRVDIKNDGLDYSLKHLPGDEIRPGTTIDVELYEHIMPSDLERARSEIRRFVAWSEIPVYLDGEQISTHPSEGKWDFEDENAWYKLSQRQILDIYNLGVLVVGASAGRYGIGGTVVSKHRLDVNFARNDVQSSCPVFKKIAKVLQSHSNDGIKKKARLTESERESLVRQFMAGDLPSGQDATMKVITDVTGRAWPLRKLADIHELNFKSTIAVAKSGDRVMERAMKNGLCFVVDEATLDRFGAPSLEIFVKRVAAACRKQCPNPNRHDRQSWHFEATARVLDCLRIATREEFAGLISDNYEPVPDKELTKPERELLLAINAGADAMEYVFIRSQCLSPAGITFTYGSKRSIKVGLSETAQAWTDGQRLIWINRNKLSLLRKGHQGAYQMAKLLLHEYLHDAPDTGTHTHDHAFFEAFHDICLNHEDNPVGAAADAMMKRMIVLARKAKKTPSKALLTVEDADAARQ